MYRTAKQLYTVYKTAETGNSTWLTSAWVLWFVLYTLSSQKLRYSLLSISHNCRYFPECTNRTLVEVINIPCLIFKNVGQNCQFGRCAYARFCQILYTLIDQWRNKFLFSSNIILSFIVKMYIFNNHIILPEFSEKVFKIWEVISSAGWVNSITGQKRSVCAFTS